MKEAERQEEQSSPVEVTKPFWRRAVKKTGTVLDWTILPITEVKKLGASLGVLVSFISIVILSLIGLFKHSGNIPALKALRNDIKEFHNPEIYYSRLTAENKELIKNLNSKFFFKRWASIGFCILACAAGVLSMILSFYFGGFGIVKTILSFIMLSLMLLYTWCSIVSLENLKLAQERLVGGASGN